MPSPGFEILNLIVNSPLSILNYDGDAKKFERKLSTVNLVTNLAESTKIINRGE